MFEDFLVQLRSKSERQRKIILWAVMLVVGALAVAWWLSITSRAFEQLRAEPFLERFNPPSAQEAFEIDIGGEIMQDWEAALQELETQESMEGPIQADQLPQTIEQ